MNIKDFDADLKIITTSDLFFSILNEVVVKKVNISDLKILIENIDERELHESTEWIRTASWVNLVVTANFVKSHYKRNTIGFQQFIEVFAGFAETIKESYSFPPLSFVYVAESGRVFRFLVYSGPSSHIFQAFNEACQVIGLLLSKRSNPLKTAAKNTYITPDNTVFLRFENKNWSVIDPLKEETEIVNKKYLKGNDHRVRKPWLVFLKDDLKERKFTSSNWSLEFDGLSTLMLQPNDVSIYSNICDQNLVAAHEFYDRIILPRHKFYHGNFPPLEQQQEYFNYFQLIITSVILAYTALEAFANICIPDRYEYTEEKNGVKTIYSKEAIERNFSLKDKFKKILAPLLNTPEPSLEPWWSRFIELEKLRNEIIHTKQSDSSRRYSTLLSKEIFNLVSAHKDVITYYGYFVELNMPELLDEFPYNFGYDNVEPGITDSLDFDLWIRNYQKTSYSKLIADLAKERLKKE